MSTDVIVWIAAVVIFAIIEAVTAGLASIWFALGAVAALVTAALHGPIWLQLIWFFVISIVTLLLTRPLARKYVNGIRQPTNADRLIGMTGLVVESIDNLKNCGAVNIGGQTWTARSSTGEPIPTGRQVVAREIQGVKLLVEESSAQ